MRRAHQFLCYLISRPRGPPVPLDRARDTPLRVLGGYLMTLLGLITVVPRGHWVGARQLVWSAGLLGVLVLQILLRPGLAASLPGTT